MSWIWDVASHISTSFLAANLRNTPYAASLAVLRVVFS